MRLFGRPASQFPNGYSALTTSPAPTTIPQSSSIDVATSALRPVANGSSSRSVPKLPAVPLTPSAFAPYGSVVQSYPDARCAPKAIPIKQVNFGTAQKYNLLSPTASPVALPEKWTAQGVEQRLNMCVFRCEPQNSIGGAPGQWEVRVLERHEFSSQSFLPMGSEDGSYLVLVALPGQGGSFLVTMHSFGPAETDLVSPLNNRRSSRPLDFASVQGVVFAGHHVPRECVAPPSDRSRCKGDGLWLRRVGNGSRRNRLRNLERA